MKSYASLVCAAIVALGLFALALGQSADTNVMTPLDYYTFVPPAAGETYTDLTFGTKIQRVSDAPSREDSANGGQLSFISGEYSTMSLFNSDNSLFILQHESYVALYDSQGRYVEDLPFAIHAGSEPRWSRRDPQILYYLAGNQLREYDIQSGAITVVRTFSEYSRISGNGESDICFDGDHFVFAGDNRDVFVYDRAADLKGPVLRTNGDFDQIYITPDDHVLIGWYSTGHGRKKGLELYDRDMNFLRQVAPAIGHMDVTRDANGQEVVVLSNSADPAPICDNGVVKIRLSDGEPTCLLELDWSLAIHVSAPDNGGWAFVETYAPSDPDPSRGWVSYTNEILQVKLDGTEVQRLVHHRSRPFNSYLWQPRVSVSRDASQLLYTSNYGLPDILGYSVNYSDVYLMEVAPSGSGSTDPGSTDPGSTDSGSTDSGSTDSGSTDSSSVSDRFEENHSAIQYGGTWHSNNNGVHSASAAFLAVDPGAAATLQFTGTGVDWIGFQDPWSGIARVYLDGVFQQEVDTYQSSQLAQQVLFSVDGLSSGDHTLTIEATGTRSDSSQGSWVWVDAFEVRSDDTGSTDSSSGTDSSGTDSSSSTSSITTSLEQDSGALEYAGTWYSNDNGVHSASAAFLAVDPGAAATLYFHGTGADWIGFQDPWSGIARVYLDGVFQQEVDTYQSSQLAQQVLFSVDGLSSGDHTLTIEATGTRSASSQGSWVWVDAFEVRSSGEGCITSDPESTPVSLEQDDPALSYTGTWHPNDSANHSAGSAALAMDPGSKVTFTFTGSAAEWVGFQDAWSGIAHVYVDGYLIGQVDTYSSSEQAQMVLFSISGLVHGTHTLVVEVTGDRNAASGGSWVWVDAFRAQ